MHYKKPISNKIIKKQEKTTDPIFIIIYELKTAVKKYNIYLSYRKICIKNNIHIEDGYSK